MAQLNGRIKEDFAKGTIPREFFDAAMKCQTEEEAAWFLNREVDRLYVKGNFPTRSKALEVAQINLGYLAGYYDDSTRDKVLRLFGAVHPIFGDKKPTTEEAFKIGVAASAAPKKDGGGR